MLVYRGVIPWRVDLTFALCFLVYAIVVDVDVFCDMKQGKSTTNQRSRRTSSKVASQWLLVGTPRKTNMSPENQWLEDVFPIEILPS